ncbi:efflux RND transporter periplasmic adaptor subunit [Alkalisalibacterium limincola]|nr:efflux RND transporter periplasmic adaptor subunit [Alkalisalibacterium limincola]
MIRVLPSPRLAVVFVALMALALAGCRSDNAGGGGQMPAATVTTTTVQPVSWTDSIRALGTAQANESVMITAKVTETVSRVNFEDGDLVEAGDVLVELSGRAELAELAEARAGLQEAQQQLNRAEQLAERQLVSRSDLDTRRAAAQSARARMDTISARLGDRVITAPFAGVLGFREVSAGTLVTPGTTIASLDDISRIRLEFTVPETFISALSVGQVVEAGSAAYPERSFEGELRTIGSRVDPVTRSVTVRAEIENADRALRPGMLMTVRIIRAPREALVIPEISVVQVGGDAFVYRVKDDDTVERVPVRIGARRAGEAEVVEGISEGDRIVVQGVVKLRDGARISEIAAEAPADPDAVTEADA